MKKLADHSYTLFILIKQYKKYIIHTTHWYKKTLYKNSSYAKKFFTKKKDVLDETKIKCSIHQPDNLYQLVQ